MKSSPSVEYAKPPAAWIFTSFPDQNQHMLYSLLAHGAMRIFGEQAWGLHLPSVLFAIASLWALFLVGRRIRRPQRSPAGVRPGDGLLSPHLVFGECPRLYGPAVLHLPG